MINERSPLIRRSPQQHYQYDRFYPNPSPNPNPKLLPKPHASMDWTGSGEPMSPQSQSAHQQKDWGLSIASSNSGSSMVPGHGEARGGGSRFKSRASELPASSTAGAAAVMRDIYNRTKVVVRHLPSGLSESAFMEQIVSRFSSMYNMVSFSPGKSSIKGSSFSRAYIDFKHPEDVLDFYQGFNGHVFVNEKGSQYKALVEYAPNQRVPKLWIKKDPREGSIFQDPDYIKFSEQVSKPVEYLPSAEAQLERKETEKNLSSVAGAKEAIIVTPLMEFVRQRRASKSMPQVCFILIISSSAHNTRSQRRASTHTRTPTATNEDDEDFQDSDPASEEDDDEVREDVVVEEVLADEEDILDDDEEA
ncbi:hypothetical protein L7F22_047954 [Adiantum nelumboides]|nr:hypothetical protein [Adiantum nelumboides]